MPGSWFPASPAKADQILHGNGGCLGRVPPTIDEHPAYALVSSLLTSHASS